LENIWIPKLGGDLGVFHKPQYIDLLPYVVKGKVLSRIDEREVLNEVSRSFKVTILKT